MKTTEIRTDMVFLSVQHVKEAYKSKLISWKESVYYINKLGK